jgi:hypothetical protein
MNRRGHRFTLYNKAHYGYGDHSTQMGYTMPLALSSKMYAHPLRQSADRLSRFRQPQEQQPEL